MATSLAVPTAGGIGRSLGSYGVGIIAGLGYRVVSGMVGSGLIGGAIAAAVTGAMVRGPAGEIIAVNAGFTTGQQGFGAIGLGDMGGLFGGGAEREDTGLQVI